MYLIVLLILVLLALLSIKSRIPDWVILLVMAVITLMMCFRFGQGTDYFGYFYNFVQLNSFSDLFTAPDVHGEIGFRVLCCLFPGEHFQAFIACVSVYEMLMFWLFLRQHSCNKALSLLLFYPTFFLVYYLSALRQGIVLATFMGLGIDLIERKQWLRYAALCVLMATVHTISLVWLIVPFVLMLRTNILLIALPAAIAVGLVSASNFFLNAVNRIGFLRSMIAPYLGNGISISAFSERLASLSVILLLYLTCYRGKQREHWWMKVYLAGHILFFVLASSQQLSGRLMANFKILEIMIVPDLLSKKSLYRQLLTPYFILLSLLMFVHNINASISQGQYLNTNVLSYPYVSTFDQDKLWALRESDRYYENALRILQASD